MYQNKKNTKLTSEIKKQVLGRHLSSRNIHVYLLPFSAETHCASVFDSKLPTDFLGFLANLRVKSNEALFDVNKKPKRGDFIS